MLEVLRHAGLPAVEVVLPPRPYPLAILALRSALLRHEPALVIVDSVTLAAVVPLF